MQAAVITGLVMALALGTGARAETWVCGGKVTEGEAALKYLVTYETRADGGGEVTGRTVRWTPVPSRLSGDAAETELVMIYDHTPGEPLRPSGVGVTFKVRIAPALAAGATQVETVMNRDDGASAGFGLPFVAQQLEKERGERSDKIGVQVSSTAPVSIAEFLDGHVVEISINGDGGRSLGVDRFDLTTGAGRDALFARALAGAEADLADRRKRCSPKGPK